MNYYNNPTNKKKNPILLIISIILIIILISMSSYLFISLENQKKSYELLDNTLTSLKENISDIIVENNGLKDKNEQINDHINGLFDHYTTLENEILSLNEKNIQLTTEKEDLQKKLSAALKTPEPVKKDENFDNLKTKIAYLTFDDGVSKNTSKILDILSKNNIKATFFVNWKPNNDSLYKRIVDEGHELANHTATHEYSTVYKSVESFEKEVMDLQNNLIRITGYTPTLFRFPGGSNNTQYKKYNVDVMPGIFDKIHELGFEYYDWNADCEDASPASYPTPLVPSKLVANVMKSANKEHLIILMHDTNAKSTTVEALQDIIDQLRAKGYVFAVIDKNTPAVQFKK